MAAEEAIVLLLVVIGAFLMPFVSRIIRVPSAVGEIIYGIALGFVISDIAHSVPIINFLSEFGFILLMYLAGMEIDTDDLKKAGRRPILFYAAYFGLIALLGFAVSKILGQPGYYVLIYLTTSIGLLYAVLNELEMKKTSLGQELLIIGSIGEIISLIGLTIFTLLHQSGFSQDTAVQVAQLALFVVAAIFIMKCFQLLIWWLPSLSRFFISTGNVTETGIRSNFLNMFVFVALAALLNLEMIVGAFIGGLLFALVFKEKTAIQSGMGTFGYGFLIPIFFIEVGLSLDPQVFMGIGVIIEALLLSVMIVTIRFAAALIFLAIDMSLRDIVLIPFSTSFALTLLVAIAKLGQEMGVISDHHSGVILLTAILTAVINPAIIRSMRRHASGIRSRITYDRT